MPRKVSASTGSPSGSAANLAGAGGKKTRVRKVPVPKKAAAKKTVPKNKVVLKEKTMSTKKKTGAKEKTVLKKAIAAIKINEETR